MTQIVISYRRDDVPDATGWIAQRLKRHFGERNVFIDIDNIPVGRDFRDHLAKTLDTADILIVIIGPNWLGRTNSGNRIHDEGDWVRLEVAAALSRKTVAVIPLLINGTPMPRSEDLPNEIREFSFRHAANFNTREFEDQIARLIKSIERLAGTPAAPSKFAGLGFWLVAFLPLLVIGIGLAIAFKAPPNFLSSSPGRIESDSRKGESSPTKRVATDMWNDAPGSAIALLNRDWCRRDSFWTKGDDGWRLVGDQGIDKIKVGSLISFLFFDDKEIPDGLRGAIFKMNPGANRIDLKNPDQNLRDGISWKPEQWPNGESIKLSKCGLKDNASLYGFRFNAVVTASPGKSNFFITTASMEGRWTTIGGASGFEVVK